MNSIRDDLAMPCNRDRCTGCGACVAVCPKCAISMEDALKDLSTGRKVEFSGEAISRRLADSERFLEKTVGLSGESRMR